MIGPHVHMGPIKNEGKTNMDYKLLVVVPHSENITVFFIVID